MATAFSLPGGQVSRLGAFSAGAKIYFFDAGTGDPLDTFTTSALTVKRAHPVVCDAYGVVPAIFLPDNTTYRLRVETSGGVEILDIDGINTDFDTVSDGGGGSIDTNTLVKTGTIAFMARDDAPTGWVLLDASTIGSASSGADKANDAYEDLFLLLWTECSDTQCPVTSGRGASASADWAANKGIALPDWAITGPSFIKV